MIWRQVRHPDLGCCSYCIGCTRQPSLAVIDPRRDAVEQYLELAGAEGVPVTHIIETHLHSDHYSGALDLAARAGATVYVHPAHPLATASTTPPPDPSPHAGRGVKVEPLADGAELRIGGRVLRVLHTPGHSQDSLCLIADDRAVLTGDTLLVGDCGRPDLGIEQPSPPSPLPSTWERGGDSGEGGGDLSSVARRAKEEVGGEGVGVVSRGPENNPTPGPSPSTGKGETGASPPPTPPREQRGERDEQAIHAAARDLWGSLQRLLELPDWYEVWPGHYGPSVCGAQMTDKSSSTIGYERRKNYALQALDADDFADLILADLPPEPAEMAAIRAHNAGG